MPAVGGAGLFELVRLGERAPTLLQLFTADSDLVRLHYVDDPTTRSYVPCPGAACPLCFLGDAPEDNVLLPVVSFKLGSVGVLRVARTRSPHSLAVGLEPHLRDPDIADKVVEITRDGARYRVQARPLGEDADRNVSAIRAYQAARGRGLLLASALPQFSAVTLAELPSIRRQLDARGGWKPPGEPRAAPPDADHKSEVRPREAGEDDNEI